MPSGLPALPAKPRKLKTPEFVIVYAGNEQEPFVFADATGYDGHVIRGVLRTGDYTVLGHESQICCERKSLADFFSTMGTYLAEHAEYERAVSVGDPEALRPRFYRELERMRAYRFRCVIVESSYAWITTKPPIHSKLHPQRALSTFFQLCLAFDVAPIFGGSRADAAAIAYRWLKYAARILRAEQAAEAAAADPF